MTSLYLIWDFSWEAQEHGTAGTSRSVSWKHVLCLKVAALAVINPSIEVCARLPPPCPANVQPGLTSEGRGMVGHPAIRMMS
jgi:hypothetical protein